ncbi:MAG: hypothetical protein KDN20_06745 [Verrucomicrobiae bacterium]|nr:hypothetical protein [Verrucomicrobiae bacterium]
MLALLAAAVILAVVGIKSFLDYKVAELEKTYGGKPAEPVAAATDATSPVTPPPPPNASTPVTATKTTLADNSTDPASGLNDLPRSVLPPIPSELLSDPNSPPPGEPEPLARPSGSQSEIETLRRETAMYQERLNQLRSGQSATNAPPAALPPDGLPSESIRPSGPGSAVSALNGTPAPTDFGPITGVIPPPPIPNGEPSNDALPPSPVQTESEVAAIAEQISLQPAIAKVVDYDPEWAILVLNGGSENNIKVEMRLAVRRGKEILGFIKVTEVEANQSIAELMSQNKFSPTARKPKPGDDIIAFNLF